jgi:hypothetical protein
MWIEVDEEILVAQRLSEDDIAFSAKNGKTTDKREPIDTGSESGDDGGDSCKMALPKLSKAVGNINEVTTRLEQQTDSEHLQLLPLLDMAQHVLKKSCSCHLRQTTLLGYFRKEA